MLKVKTLVVVYTRKYKEEERMMPEAGQEWFSMCGKSRTNYLLRVSCVAGVATTLCGLGFLGPLFLGVRQQKDVVRDKDGKKD
jgi:hypothetical protein